VNPAAPKLVNAVNSVNTKRRYYVNA
jgi:hypothetical protein